MRGVAFIGGDGPSAHSVKELVGEVDLVVAADSGLIAAEAADYRVDWIVGDMDSLDDLSRLESYPEERIIRHPREKDYTDTELALELLWDKGCTDLSLVGGGGGRTDHILAIAALFDRPKSPDRWLTAGEDIRLVKNAVHIITEEDSLVSLFPVGSGPWKAESQGLKWPLDGLTWQRGSIGISNRAESGSFSIRVHEGRFMLLTLLG